MKALFILTMIFLSSLSVASELESNFSTPDHDILVEYSTIHNGWGKWSEEEQEESKLDAINRIKERCKRGTLGEIEEKLSHGKFMTGKRILVGVCFY